jgi:CHASE3 domain sensor protein
MKTSVLLIACAAILLVIGAVGYSSLNGVKRRAREITANDLPGLLYAGEISTERAESFGRVLLLITSDSVEENAKYVNELEQMSRQMDQSLKQYEATILSGETKDPKYFNKLTVERERYREIRSQVIELIKNGKRQEALQITRASLLPSYETYRAAGRDFFDYNARSADSAGQAILRACWIAQMLLAVVAIVIFIGGIAMPIIAASLPSRGAHGALEEPL